jgi:hypothetical protein
MRPEVVASFRDALDGLADEDCFAVEFVVEKLAERQGLDRRGFERQGCERHGDEPP